jgi:hypothetical protein
MTNRQQSNHFIDDETCAIEIGVAGRTKSEPYGRNGKDGKGKQ